MQSILKLLKISYMFLKFIKKMRETETYAIYFDLKYKL